MAPCMVGWWVTGEVRNSKAAQCISIILRLYHIYLSFEINLKLHFSDIFYVPWIH